MIKALVNDEGGRRVLMFGLSKMNLQKLKQNFPIHFDMKEDLGVDMRCLIFYGKNEDDMQKAFMKGITGDIEIKRDNPLSLREELIKATEDLVREVDNGTLVDLVDMGTLWRVKQALKNIK